MIEEDLQDLEHFAHAVGHPRFRPPAAAPFARCVVGRLCLAGN
ncbi:MAG: hypothetical protein ACKVUS_22670 [Saprospiraceae bacterium]